MVELSQPAGRNRRSFAGRGRRLLLLLSGCVAIAAAASLGLDWWQMAQRRRSAAADRLPPDRSMLPAPNLRLWQPTPLAAGSAAPDFRLPDVRTGRRVSLGDYRGRPVVLLLSSFG